jgi:hypothetical protein
MRVIPSKGRAWRHIECSGSFRNCWPEQDEQRRGVNITRLSWFLPARTPTLWLQAPKWRSITWCSVVQLKINQRMHLCTKFVLACTLCEWNNSKELLCVSDDSKHQKGQQRWKWQRPCATPGKKRTQKSERNAIMDDFVFVWSKQ